MAQSPNISNLTRLTLTGAVHGAIISCGSEALSTLFASNKMSNGLVDLDLSFSGIDHAILQQISALRIDPTDPTSPLKYANLTKLNVSDAPVDSSGIKAICDNFTELVELDLSNLHNGPTQGITDTALSHIIHSNLHNLTKLHLGLSPITVNGFQQLAESQLLDQLKVLDCSDGYSLALGITHILKSPLVSNLTSLGFYLGPRFNQKKERDGGELKYLTHCNVGVYLRAR